jgi:hypothetical protein
VNKPEGKSTYWVTTWDGRDSGGRRHIEKDCCADLSRHAGHGKCGIRVATALDADKPVCKRRGVGHCNP